MFDAKEYAKNWRIKNREKCRQTSRKWASENKDKIREKNRLWVSKNRQWVNERQRIKNFNIKKLIFEKYGMSCICCGENKIEFLTIDHISGNGAEHRKSIKKQSGLNFYRWLKKNSFPSGFRTLCFNCNASLGNFGYCPHGNIKIEKNKDEISGTLFC